MSALLAALLAMQTQATMTEQAGADWHRADAAMTAQYRALMAQMKIADEHPEPDAGTGPSYENALLASQRAWLAYRDAECVFAGYQFRGGSAQPMAELDCKAKLTRARTAELKASMPQH